MKTVLERFLEYAEIDTQSIEQEKGKETHPSSPNQLVLMDLLKAELREMGLPNECVTSLGDGSTLVFLPPTKGREHAPHIVFAAHVDTYFGCPGGAKPIIHEYNGGDIVLLNDGIIIPAKDLDGLEGKRIVTADGTTLLGADDKAGVAALMCLIEEILRCEVAHGPLTIWFCTDEEIGKVGVSFLPGDTAKHWDFFWTVDGKELNTVDVGCFYGAKIRVEFRGNDTHPGVSGQNLRPAHYAAARFIDKLGDVAVPWKTDGDESFIYVPALPAGSAGKTDVTVFPRTFRQEEFPTMRATIVTLANEAAERYGVTVNISETEVMYVTTEVAINNNPQLLQAGLNAFRKFGIEPKLHRVRAGTDGAMLNMTYPNVPAPNMGTGAHNLHGVREFLVADELEYYPELLVEMVLNYSGMTK